jgi:signal transduction histidine kinase
MAKFRFEYRIALIYLIVGFIYIIFSDLFINSVSKDPEVITEMQTYKGIGYVLVTALLLFFLMRGHLQKLRSTEKELEHHRDNLQELVQEKTAELDEVIEELRETNEKLHSNSELVSRKNEELEEAMQHLKTTQSQLFQREKMASLGVLTAGVAHEINNPLNFILGGVTGLEEMLGEVQDEKTALYLESIRTGVERATAIVTGLNEISAVSESYDEVCDLNQVVENCLTVVHKQLDRIGVIRNLSEEGVVVKGNVGQLHQVILNILVNAIQSIDKPGSIAIFTGAAKGKASVTISDTGCGIEQSDIDKVTDPFYTTKSPGEGIGIGLSIAYNIVQAHQGSLSIRSEPGKGTTVKVVLPEKLM